MSSTNLEDWEDGDLTLSQADSLLAQVGDHSVLENPLSGLNMVDREDFWSPPADAASKAPCAPDAPLPHHIQKSIQIKRQDALLKRQRSIQEQLFKKEQLTYRGTVTTKRHPAVRSQGPGGDSTLNILRFCKPVTKAIGKFKFVPVKSEVKTPLSRPPIPSGAATPVSSGSSSAVDSTRPPPRTSAPAVIAVPPITPSVSSRSSRPSSLASTNKTDLNPGRPVPGPALSAANFVSNAPAVIAAPPITPTVSSGTSTPSSLASTINTEHHQGRPVPFDSCLPGTLDGTAEKLLSSELRAPVKSCLPSSPSASFPNRFPLAILSPSIKTTPAPAALPSSRSNFPVTSTPYNKENVEPHRKKMLPCLDTDINLAVPGSPDLFSPHGYTNPTSPLNITPVKKNGASFSQAKISLFGESSGEDEDEMYKIPAGSSLSAPTAKPPTKLKPLLSNKYPDIPKNPLNFMAYDDDGEPLDIATKQFSTAFVKQGKHNPATSGQMQREFEFFLKFCRSYPEIGEEATESMLNSNLPEEDVAWFLCQFILNRVNMNTFRNMGEFVPIDLSTFERSMTQLCIILSEKTKYKVLGNPLFDSVREHKSTYMRKAKELFAMGSMDGQADPLTMAEVNYLLHNDVLSLYSPFGLTALLYLQLTFYFNCRVRKEIINMTRDEIRLIYDESGNPKLATYVPNTALKADKGEYSASTVRGSKLFRRACSLPCPAEPKLDMFRVMEVFDYHLAKLPYTGPPGKQKLFHQLRSPFTRDLDSKGFFHSSSMGVDFFDNLTHCMCSMTGLDTQKRKITNQSLRVTAFNMQELLGFSEGETAARVGHSNPKTQRIYKRKSYEKLAKDGGSTQVLSHGVPVTQPNTKQVLCKDGTVREPKPFLPTADEHDPNIVHMNRLPISSKLQDIELPIIISDSEEELSGHDDSDGLHPNTVTSPKSLQKSAIKRERVSHDFSDDDTSDLTAKVPLTASKIKSAKMVSFADINNSPSFIDDSDDNDTADLPAKACKKDSKGLHKNPNRARLVKNPRRKTT